MHNKNHIESEASLESHEERESRSLHLTGYRAEGEKILKNLEVQDFLEEHNTSINEDLFYVGRNNLKGGLKGIEKLQQALNTELESNLAIDGLYGPKTRSILKALLRRRKIKKIKTRENSERKHPNSLKVAEIDHDQTSLQNNDAIRKEYSDFIQTPIELSLDARCHHLSNAMRLYANFDMESFHFLELNLNREYINQLQHIKGEQLTTKELVFFLEEYVDDLKKSYPNSIVVKTISLVGHNIKKMDFNEDDEYVFRDSNHQKINPNPKRFDIRKEDMFSYLLKAEETINRIVNRTQFK